MDSVPREVLAGLLKILPDVDRSVPGDPRVHRADAFPSVATAHRTGSGGERYSGLPSRDSRTRTPGVIDVSLSPARGGAHSKVLGRLGKDQPRMFDRILAGFDGSPTSRRAVQVASEIAGRFQSVLTIAVVRPPNRGEEMARLDALVPMAEDGRTLVTILEEFRERALAHGARMVEPVTLHGEVLDSLLDYLARNPQDLVVVGSRGLSRSRRLLLGSVSAGLVNSAHCPVLVVRPGPPHPAKPLTHAEGHSGKSSIG